MLFIYFQREWRRGRKRGRKTSICCLSHTLNWGPGLQPRPVPLPGIEPEPFRFAGWHPAHSATTVRANPVFSMGKTLGHFKKQDMQLAKEHMKKGSTSLDIRGTLIGTIMWDDYTRMAKMKSKCCLFKKCVSVSRTTPKGRNSLGGPQHSADGCPVSLGL